jgi:hypothetical protein
MAFVVFEVNKLINILHNTFGDNKNEKSIQNKIYCRSHARQANEVVEDFGL